MSLVFTCCHGVSDRQPRSDAPAAVFRL